ncbi:hybrid sensor histidine kinase/response regulator [Aquimarina agarilytica]|uniref:hybrid sensor histidine kinase/response regulator n=1 Tax=Aquimarina agarilytica TaxID=1087449 RepID=UPI000287F003|nr:hybrid sensor histidine kinase/response regulator [Aquimarina agarilytica]
MIFLQKNITNTLSNKYNNFINFCIYCLLGITLSNAQENTSYKFKRIGQNYGLSSNWVYSVFQDDLGFIWIGTGDGLNRFDGYQCKTYRPKNEYDNTLGNIAFNSIAQKQKNELWTATSSGLYIFKNNQLTLYKASPKLNYRDVFTENETTTWLTSQSGLIRLNTIDSTSINFSKNPRHSAYRKPFYKIFKDSESNLWFTSTGCVFKYTPNNQKFEKFSHFQNLNPQTKHDILAITEDQSGMIWVGFGQDGLFYYNPKEGNKKFKKYSDGTILHLHADKYNQLWVGRASNQGLEKIDLTDNHKSTIFKYQITNPESISDNSIFSILEDNSGDIWVGTFGGGLNYTSKREKKIYTIDRNSLQTPIENNLVNEIVEEEKFLWIGTEGGVSKLDKETNTIQHYTYNASDKNSLSRDPVHKIYKDSKGNLWIGTWDGCLNLYNYEKDNFKRYLASPNDGDIHSDHVLAIAEDSKNRLWIGTNGGGLYQYNYNTDSFKSYTHILKYEDGSPIRDITHIQETQNGELLLNTYHSIIFFKPDQNTFQEFPFNTHQSIEPILFMCSLSDTSNTIWIGTNIGVFQFDRKTEKYIAYTKYKELTNLSIKALIQDTNGILWASTNNGIFKINEKKNLITKYTKQDGFSSNEFKKEAAYINKKGVLYFGTSNGLNYFNPNELKVNEKSPSLAITSFAVLHSTPNENNKYQSILENPNNEKEIQLTHKQSSFVISYTGLNYLHPEKNNYRYKLEGYDKVWVDAGTSLAATYTNVKPGNYQFKVLGSNNDGKWSELPKKLSITISAPWYKTDLFKTVLAMFLLTLPLIFYFVRLSFYKKQERLLKKQVAIRTNEINKQNKELSDHRNHLEKLVEGRTNELNKAKLKAEESDRLKSAFIANMSHEIRTPMNAIYGFSNLLNEEDITKEERAEFTEIINSSCDSLLVLIDDILDISILDAQGIDLQLSETNIFNFLSEIETIYKQKETQTLKLDFIYNENQKNTIITTDPIRLKQILSNLLNNAFKFTEKGSISFGFNLSEDSKKITFYVKDTGIGIAEKDLEVIFNPFLKAGNNTEKLYRGTGIGLSISQKLAHTFKGSISVASEIEKGTTFYVEIPTNHSFKNNS